MKRALTLLLAGWMTAACNNEYQTPGPEYTTLPVVSNTTYAPETVYDGDEVEVSAYVSNKYGRFGVGAAYQLNDNAETLQQAGYYYYPETAEVQHFTATIPGQAAGTKVQVQVQCINDYGVMGLGEIIEYVVRERPESGDE